MPESSEGARPASPDSPSQSTPEVVVKGQAQPAPKSISDIESEMDATRARLAETLDELKYATAPKNIINRQVSRVKSFYVDDYGAVRVDHVAATVGVVVTVVVVRKVWKRITR